MLGNFEYKKIRSIDEGCQCLAEAAGKGSILAGGTDLLVEIRNQLKSPGILIDCKGVEALKNLHIDRAGSLIGASVPLNRLIENRKFYTTYPALTKALLSIGTYQLRSRATLAGNICNASPAADSAPVLLVLDACVEAVGTKGVRTIPLRNFFAGVKKTVLASDEIVVSLRIPERGDLKTAFLKQQRIRGHDLAVVNVAGSFSPSEKILRLAIGSCAPTPVLLKPIEVDSRDLAAFFGHVTRLVQSSVSPISDVRASADYRNAILPILVKRVLQSLLAEGGAS